MFYAAFKDVKDLTILFSIDKSGKVAIHKILGVGADYTESVKKAFYESGSWTATRSLGVNIKTNWAMKLSF